MQLEIKRRQAELISFTIRLEFFSGLFFYVEISRMQAGYIVRHTFSEKKNYCRN